MRTENIPKMQRNAILARMNGNKIIGFKRDIASSLRQAGKEGITREKSIDVADKLVHKWKIN